METIVRSVAKKQALLLSGILFLVMTIIVGCGAPRNTSNPENYEELKNLVENREFAIEFQWAQPQGGGMIDLMSNPNHIRFKGDEVDIFLPYFGVRHRGGAYGSNTGGIKYEGKVSNLNISEDPSKNNILMKFEGRQDTEILVFNVTLYENGKAHASVSSSERNNIIYQGGDVKLSAQVAER